MRIEDLSHKIIVKTLSLLEEKYHYKIPDAHKHEIEALVMSNIDALIAGKDDASAKKK